MNNICIKPVFFTTLDICHILHTLKFLDIFEKDNFINKISIEDFFYKNKDILNNVHFNNIKNWGLKDTEHAYFFDKSNEEDILFIKKILKLLKDLNLDIFITLEILEEDYILCPNFGKTLEAIKYVEQTFL